MAGQVGFESAAGLNETIREQVANMLASAATGLSNLLSNVLSGGSEALVEGATFFALIVCLLISNAIGAAIT